MKHEQIDNLNRAIDEMRAQKPADPSPQFASALERRLSEQFTKNHMQRPFLKTFFQKRWVLTTGAIAVVAILALLNFVPGLRPGIQRDEPAFDKLVLHESLAQSDFDLTPTKADRFGVEPDTAFILKTKTAVAQDDLRSSLAIAPAVSFAVSAKGDREFEVRPTVALAKGTVYEVALGSTVERDGAAEKQRFSWAFQVKDDLRIEGTLPRHKATGVPVNTGIEVTFNTDGVKDFEPHFRVVPETAGRFEHHGRVWAFVPQDPLAKGTLYTVTVTKDLPLEGSSSKLAGDFIFQFETAQATDTSPQAFYGTFDEAFHAVRTAEAPVIDFSYVSLPDGKVQATIFRFKDAKDLIERMAPVDTIPPWAYESSRSATISTDGMTKIGAYDLTADANALRFPSGFDAGYYLIDLTTSGRHLQTLFSASELSGSLTVSQTDSLLWLYDLESGKPLVGAGIANSLDDAEDRTDDKGIARLPTPADLQAQEPVHRRAYFIVTAKDGRQTILPAVVQQSFFQFGRQGADPATGDYLKYLWSDRTLYRPTDTINVWGIVRNRLQPKTETVTLEVWTWNLVDARGDYLPLVKETVKTGDFSTFSTSLKLQQLKPGYYTLSAKMDGKTLASRSFEVRTFTKPAYRIVVTPDRAAGIHGEEVMYDIRTEFFDGTPAPKIKLAYAEYGGSGSSGTALTTDDQGHATVKQKLDVKAEQYAGYGTSGRMQHLTFFPTEGVEGNIAAETDVFVYPSGVTFAPEAKVSGTTATVTLTLREVDLSAPPYWSWFGQNAAESGKPVPNATITGTVYEIITTKTKTGERYDFLEKQVVPDYRYETHEETREEFRGTTDAQGTFSKTFQLTGDSYRVALTAADAKGRTITRSAYAARVGRQSFDSTGSAYSVQDVNARTSIDTYVPPPTYKLGATTEFVFTRQGEPVAAEGAFLFIKLQNGIREITVNDTPRLSATMQEADMPSVSYTAVWFDGKNFLAPDAYNLVPMLYDSSERKLTVQVTPDKKTYAPGETAQLTVTTKDAEGKPKRAAVSLSGVDEALSAIQQDNAPYPLTSLYASVPSGLLQLYVSHAPLRASSGAEGGGGGGDVRKDFRDAPLWIEVVTNANGTAAVPFKLPDNITSWRVTAQGVSEDLYAGDTVTMVPVTKSIFGTLTMNDEYVGEDRPTVIARAYGSALKSDTSISFTLEAPGLGDPQTKTGKPFTAERFTLPAFTVGAHEVKLTVSAESGKDTLIKTVNIVPSRLTQATSRFLEAAPGQTIEGSDQERTTLALSDTGRGRILNTAQGLAWAYGKRLDRHLGAHIATDVLKKLEAQRDTADTGFKPLDFQVEDGGIALVVYGSSDLPLSAMAAARADLFDRTQLHGYFVKKLQDKNASPEHISWTLLGLAHLREPVLPDLETFLGQENISDEDRLRIALAYLALGAQDRAGTLAKSLLEKYGETQDPYVRLALGNGDDAPIINTARFAILAEGLKLKERLGLDAYLRENFPKDTLTNLERALAAETAVPLLDDQDVSLRYRLEGAEHDLTIKGGETKSLSLTPAQLKEFSIVSVQGPVGITVLSIAPLDTDTTPKNGRLSLSRRYSVVGGARRPPQEGDIVRIDFTPKASREVVDQTFFVTDLLPSGLTLLSNPWQRGFNYEQDLGYPIEESGQRVTFFTSGNRAFHYYARVVTPGSFAAEPALLQGQTSRDLLTYTGGQTLEIR